MMQRSCRRPGAFGDEPPQDSTGPPHDVVVLHPHAHHAHGQHAHGKDDKNGDDPVWAMGILHKDALREERVFKSETGIQEELERQYYAGNKGRTPSNERVWEGSKEVRTALQDILYLLLTGRPALQVGGSALEGFEDAARIVPDITAATRASGGQFCIMARVSLVGIHVPGGFDALSAIVDGDAVKTEETQHQSLNMAYPPKVKEVVAAAGGQDAWHPLYTPDEGDRQGLRAMHPLAVPAAELMQLVVRAMQRAGLMGARALPGQQGRRAAGVPPAGPPLPAAAGGAKGAERVVSPDAEALVKELLHAQDAVADDGQVLDGIYPRSCSHFVRKGTHVRREMATMTRGTAAFVEGVGAGCLDPLGLANCVRIVYVRCMNDASRAVKVVLVPGIPRGAPLEAGAPSTAHQYVSVFTRFHRLDRPQHAPHNDDDGTGMRLLLEGRGLGLPGMGSTLGLLEHMLADQEALLSRLRGELAALQEEQARDIKGGVVGTHMTPEQRRANWAARAQKESGVAAVQHTIEYARAVLGVPKGHTSEARGPGVVVGPSVRPRSSAQGNEKEREEDEEVVRAIQGAKESAKAMMVGREGGGGGGGGGIVRSRAVHYKDATLECLWGSVCASLRDKNDPEVCYELFGPGMDLTTLEPTSITVEYADSIGWNREMDVYSIRLEVGCRPESHALALGKGGGVPGEAEMRRHLHITMAVVRTNGQIMRGIKGVRQIKPYPMTLGYRLKPENLQVPSAVPLLLRMFQDIYGKSPLMQAMLDGGMQWDRVPLHVQYPPGVKEDPFLLLHPITSMERSDHRSVQLTLQAMKGLEGRLTSKDAMLVVPGALDGHPLQGSPNAVLGRIIAGEPVEGLNEMARHAILYSWDVAHLHGHGWKGGAQEWEWERTGGRKKSEGEGEQEGMSVLSAYTLALTEWIEQQERLRSMVSRMLVATSGRLVVGYNPKAHRFEAIDRAAIDPSKNNEALIMEESIARHVLLPMQVHAIEGMRLRDLVHRSAMLSGHVAFQALCPGADLMTVARDRHHSGLLLSGGKQESAEAPAPARMHLPGTKRKNGGQGAQAAVTTISGLVREVHGGVRAMQALSAHAEPMSKHVSKGHLIPSAYASRDNPWCRALVAHHLGKEEDASREVSFTIFIAHTHTHTHAPDTICYLRRRWASARSCRAPSNRSRPCSRACSPGTPRARGAAGPRRGKLFPHNHM